MARAKEFDAVPDPAMVLIAKVLDATRNKQKLSDPKRYPGAFPVGEHRLIGTLEYDIAFTKGMDTTADRFYGVPIDTVLLLAFHYCGALREHFARAAAVCIEMRKAELEGPNGEDGEPRPYQDVTFTFPEVAKGKKKIVNKTITIPASEIQKEADRIAGKLTGVDEEETAWEQELRKLYQQQIDICAKSLKVSRKYEGPINLEDVSLTVHPDMVVVQAEAA